MNKNPDPWPPQPTWISAEDFFRVGACQSGVLDFMDEHQITDTAVRAADLVARFPGNEWILIASGYGGFGYGYGDGDGDGYGYGYGYGDGAGYGDG